MISLDEKKELLQTILNEGNEKKFEYKGYECLIKRMENRWHLCGYIKYRPEYSNEWEALNSNFHGGVSYNNYLFGWLGEEWIGFDCMQSDDRTPHDVLFEEQLVPTWDGAAYRTMEYVEECLINAIDNLEHCKSSLQNNL
ncbi:hypothetical protein [Mammaliicoccus sciuri]|uniref:hypothetical protein n=1 Tax=Mammaliicoccus sciuri TaxID=1296 RepID=UPI002DB7AD10|nr:hypothetical protein [Mammaliicoccus sciuri]MEB6232528.1 hypothetical protein [Mammaliicoccus sciuri]